MVNSRFLIRSIIIIISLVALTACNNNTENHQDELDTVEIQQPDATKFKNDSIIPEATPADTSEYSNKRFKDVTVEKSGENKFKIEGKAQIFEANFGWVVEDGHNELKKGFEMTDAGAPEWGNFSFTVEVDKERENSTLMLILFETSAKDGSRVHELPVVLY